MDAILRSLVVYGFLLVVFRLSGKRTLSEATPFDLVLLLIISETTQQAMVGEDHSLTNAGLLIMTLVGVDILLSVLKQQAPLLNPLIDGTAVVLARDGQPLPEVLKRERIDAADLLEAARLHGNVSDLSEVALAVLERGGRISIVPRGSSRSACLRLLTRNQRTGLIRILAWTQSRTRWRRGPHAGRRVSPSPELIKAPNSRSICFQSLRSALPNRPLSNSMRQAVKAAPCRPTRRVVARSRSSGPSLSSPA